MRQNDDKQCPTMLIHVTSYVIGVFPELKRVSGANSAAREKCPAKGPSENEFRKTDQSRLGDDVYESLSVLPHRDLTFFWRNSGHVGPLGSIAKIVGALRNANRRF